MSLVLNVSALISKVDPMGVMSKEERCGLDLKGTEHLLFSDDEGDAIVNSIIEKTMALIRHILLKERSNIFRL
ncbi:hypothetical protein [Hafnia alvei]|nr:hypothetical protein [Hafnia alvei]